MMEQAAFTLRGRNPDVLTCIANLSNDEVFTPPEFANRMLDTLADAWAASHDGANIWADKKVRFLDPCTKSGVFLREITRRLTEGLAGNIPNLEERVNHILTKQVFGIGITHLTSLLARRSVYCSKHANGPHSIAKGFDNDAGNIWFERTEHTWTNGKCAFCGASQSALDRGEELETHAYAFIHTDNIKARIAELFGGDMQFDVIIGNPPYQLASDGGTRDIPIYQHFVNQAKNLEPRLLVMVIPSRWMATGLGLKDFRESMLADHRIRQIVDFERMDQVFPGVDFEGGACYFLWDRDHEGLCSITSVSGEEVVGPVARSLDEFDILVRDSRSLSILKKVLAHKEKSITEILSADKEFGWTSNFTGFHDKPKSGDVALHYNRSGKRLTGWIARKDVTKSAHLIDTWKVMVPAAYGERGARPAKILGPTFLASSPSVCTQTYLFFYVGSQSEAESISSYMETRFFRFLVSLRKITQHATRATYTWVPMQKWNLKWTDERLYKKYGITKEEIAFISSMIRPIGDTDE
jgi:site-specific DNA-methyltransferase (adenine-specific)